MLYTFPDFLAALRTAVWRAMADNAAQKAAVDAKKAAIVAGNLAKVASGEDTATTRLMALQASLVTAQANLKRAPAGLFDQALADLAQTQTDVARGLDYVKAHPEFTALIMRNIDEYLRPQWVPVFPVLSHISLNSYAAPTQIVISPANSGSPYADYLPAADAMIIGLMDFLGDQTVGRPLLGELGGNRDRIMRDLATASNDFLRKGYARDLGPRVDTPVIVTFRPGSISGTVELEPVAGNSTLVPVAYAMVSFGDVTSHNWGGLGTPSTIGAIKGTIPGAITDENGNFVIPNLAPGTYVLCADSNRIVVEVKANTETKLPAPLIFPRRIPGHAGGG